MNTHEDQIKKLSACIRQNGGATVAYPSFEYIDRDDAWYFPALPDKTKIIDNQELSAALNEFIVHNDAELRLPNRYLGAWRDPATSKIHLDVNIRVENTEEAIKKACEISTTSNYKIKSIYNIRRDKEITIDE